MNLTGPLGKQYCLLFKFLALFSLFYAIVCMISLAYFLMRPPQNTNLIGMLVLIQLVVMQPVLELVPPSVLPMLRLQGFLLR